MLWLLFACRVEFGPPDAGGTASDGAKELWLYTSMYEEVIQAMRPHWESTFPDLQIEVYQAGSEKVAQRFEAERSAGGSRACLLATSDPNWYADLAHEGALRGFVPPRALDLDRRWVSPHYTTIRLSMMVLAHSGGEGPTSFEALAEPEWAGRITSPDPLASGTSFTTWSALESRYGEEWLDAVHNNGLVASGGNSSTHARLDSKERDVGMLLLENILLKTSEVVEPVYPDDGAMPVMGPVAIPTACAFPLEAQAVADWFLTETAQQIIVDQKMHSPVPGMAAPDGARPLEKILLQPEPKGVDGAAFKERWAGRMAAP